MAESSSSQPTDGPGSGGAGSGAGRPINPATQRPVREPVQREQPEATEPFSTDDLRRWEDSRIGELQNQLASLSSVQEGTEVEVRAILRNELILAVALLVGAGAIFGIAREVMKMKEAGNAIAED